MLKLRKGEFFGEQLESDGLVTDLALKPAQGAWDWQAVESFRLGKADYLIPVDEFAEVELSGSRVLTREELRSVCDREKTREAIVKALRHGP